MTCTCYRWPLTKHLAYPHPSHKRLHHLGSTRVDAFWCQDLSTRQGAFGQCVGRQVKTTCTYSGPSRGSENFIGLVGFTTQLSKAKAGRLGNGGSVSVSAPTEVQVRKRSFVRSSQWKNSNEPLIMGCRTGSSLNCLIITDQGLLSMFARQPPINVVKLSQEKCLDAFLKHTTESLRKPD